MEEDMKLVGIEIIHDPSKKVSSKKLHEQSVAIHDLLDSNVFELIDHKGPYNVTLQTNYRHLHFDFKNYYNQSLKNFLMALGPFKKIIYEYNIVCNNYYEAIKTKSPSQIQSIDMGRKSIHDEGAELLKKRLNKIIWLDDLTSRRLFTLICIMTSKEN